MAVSLGMRVSGLLVAGAVAVAAAAFTSDGGGSADGRGGGGTVVTAGPSDTVRSLPTWPSARSAPAVRPSPDGHIGAPALTGTPSASQGMRATESPALSSPSPSPTMSQKLLEAPAWLAPGPDSPNLDGAADPSSVYDLLRAPTECRNALSQVPGAPADAEWTVLRGLATACLAVQGEGGSWEQAASDHAASAGGADTCKGRAAYAVLGGLLDFHRRHPGASVRLKPTASGTPAACGYRIAGVDTGGDGEARPGETIGIELADAHFDPGELLRDGVVSIGGQQVAGVPVLKPDSGGRLVLSVVVPALGPGSVDVAVGYAGVEVRVASAFTVATPDVVQEPGAGTGPGAPGEVSHGSDAPPGARGTARPATTAPQTTDGRSPLFARSASPPDGVLPLGPLPAHLTGPHAPARLRIP
ncbi:hypothetical protein EJ357_09500 [Streptomyces cyaneochromogenes]|uniref:Secreted protein n=1 Tax=Streptomyces cyaneochromogenes TaxID=2496836 RepID=A0A3Q9ER25_9ACTN|nr:hypothetical protein [Streptomyces cyaneochromogenes]AZQ33668.1 hypothetical protein EJ357_09500 [Streptomyces cyaneochromogenes]